MEELNPDIQETKTRDGKPNKPETKRDSQGKRVHVLEDLVLDLHKRKRLSKFNVIIIIILVVNMLILPIAACQLLVKDQPIDTYEGGDPDTGIGEKYTGTTHSLGAKLILLSVPFVFIALSLAYLII